MQAVGVGIPAFVILILAQWATNKGNLYSGALSVVALTGVKQTYVVLALGALGLLTAIAGIQDYFVPLLMFLGNFLPPVAAAMIVHTLLIGENAPPAPRALVAVLVGGAAGYAVEYAGISFPSSIVAFLAGGLTHWFVARLQPAPALA